MIDGMHVSKVTGYFISDRLEHCRGCLALIEKELSVDGFGIRCGCLAKEYRRLKKAVLSDVPLFKVGENGYGE